MYANIYQIRTNKYNFDKNNYISSIKQKNTNYPQNKPLQGKYLNKRPNSTKYISQPSVKNQNIAYDYSKNLMTKAKPMTNRRTNNSSK